MTQYAQFSQDVIPLSPQLIPMPAPMISEPGLVFNLSHMITTAAGVVLALVVWELAKMLFASMRSNAQNRTIGFSELKTDDGEKKK